MVFEIERGFHCNYKIFVIVFSNLLWREKTHKKSENFILKIYYSNWVIDSHRTMHGKGVFSIIFISLGTFDSSVYYK